MIDLKLLRDDFGYVRACYERRGGVDNLERIRALDERHRELLGEVEHLRAEHNKANKAIGGTPPEQRQDAIASAKAIGEKAEALTPELERVAAELEEAASYLPNLPHESVPDGHAESDNVVERTFGERTEFDFEPKEHVELGESLGIFDSDRAAKTSGSRFVYLTGPGVILELALVRFVLDYLSEHRFTPVVPPVLVRRRAMYGTGFLPADEHEFYRMERDELFLTGTSEVALASMHSDEILASNDLPVRYAGYSPCFRREAGSYGKDTKGLIRVHQFDKVEQFSFCHPDDSWDEFQAIRANQERILQNLEIPYRVLVMCAGDLGASAAKKVDNEAWLPGAKRYLELTSASNTTDYQARRLHIRWRGAGSAGPQGGKGAGSAGPQDKPGAGSAGPQGGKGAGSAKLVHTLNGTACAVGRTIVALLENHQRPDGSVRIPDALHPYTGFKELRPAE
ncbi:MAG: serine--tRNA ligase [Actinobacteria bacterium]|nr:serine--tRNA ligase [Actinomycetota bacterium]